MKGDPRTTFLQLVTWLQIGLMLNTVVNQYYPTVPIALFPSLCTVDRCIRSDDGRM